MLRFGSLSFFGIALLFGTFSWADNPPENDPFKKTVAVQKAMSRANDLLRENHAQKAVEVLEEQLTNVAGNKGYLVLLRDAYRAHIRDLYLAGHSNQARRYLDRLSILDPAAAEQFVKPVVDTRRTEPEPEPAKQEKKIGFPQFRMPAFTNPFAKKAEPKEAVPAKPPVVRFVAEDSIVEDPFERKNQRDVVTDTSKAQAYLARGFEEFERRHYPEAHKFFEQACKIDPKSVDSCRDQLAYCMIQQVTDQLNAPAAAPANWTAMQQQIQGAVQMAPKLQGVGQKLMEQIDLRARMPIGDRPQVIAGSMRIQHLGSNNEGWQVAKTPCFLVFHHQTPDYAERIAAIAENTRVAMYRKWFGHDGVEWEKPCEVILHANVSSYSQMTGQSSNVPGHSRIESDYSGRVIARRMDLRHDITSTLDAVLPHEATHVVLAGMFGTKQLPRWVDEGIAVLSEPEDKISVHRRNLIKHHQEGQLFGLKELMELNDYPQPRRIGAFYAQSVVLVEFLAQQRGPKLFTDFVKDGLRQGYEFALKRHYDLTFAQLEQQWRDQILNHPERLAAKK